MKNYPKRPRKKDKTVLIAIVLSLIVLGYELFIHYCPLYNSGQSFEVNYVDTSTV